MHLRLLFKEVCLTDKLLGEHFLIDPWTINYNFKKPNLGKGNFKNYMKIVIYLAKKVNYR